MVTPHLSANLCLLGDFNAKNLAWFCGQVTDGPGTALKELADAGDLKQVVDQPTYNVTTNHPSLLDLFFTNKPQCVRSSCVADHCQLLLASP